MSKDITLVKIKVCTDCQSPEIIFKDCICTYSKDYDIVELEFERCNCCGRTASQPADTEFNTKQLESLQ